MVNMINPLCLLILLFQTLLHLPIVSTFHLNNIFNPNYQNPDINGDNSVTINRIVRQVEDDLTTKLTESTEILENTTKFIDNHTTSTTDEYEDEDDLPGTISSADEKTTIKPEKTRSTKDKLDAFLAGPLIVVGAISLVSLCLFLLYVCKYRSTGSSGEFVTPTA